jgi:hypothetical protein
MDLPWAWTFERHQLTFEVDPGNAIAEEDERNNALTIDTDALSVGFYVEKSIYDHFRAHQRDFPEVHSTSFEDWANRQIALYNELFRRAVYPETPNGVSERLRLDNIHLVADGALPLDPRAFQISRDPEGAPATRPNVADRTVDLEWGFPKTAMASFANLTDRAIFNPFYWYSGAVQHEMGHCRGMVDVYAFAVLDGFPGFEVDITEGGTRIAGTPILPGRSETINGFTGKRLSTAETGLMSLDWTYLDRLSAVVWERMKGRRAKFGNYNESEDIGWFLNDLLPLETRVRILDGAGKPVPGVRLQVFQATPPTFDHWLVPYPRVYDGVDDLRATTGADGEASLGHNPWAASGPVIHIEDFSNATVIIRAEKDGSVKYFPLPVNEAIERAVPDGSAATAVRALSF